MQKIHQHPQPQQQHPQPHQENHHWLPEHRRGNAYHRHRLKKVKIFSGGSENKRN